VFAKIFDDSILREYATDTQQRCARVATSEKDFSGSESRYESLEEVTNLVVRVATQVEELLKLESKGNPGVSFQVRQDSLPNRDRAHIAPRKA